MSSNNELLDQISKLHSFELEQLLRTLASSSNTQIQSELQSAIATSFPHLVVCDSKYSPLGFHVMEQITRLGGVGKNITKPRPFCCRKRNMPEEIQYFIDMFWKNGNSFYSKTLENEWEFAEFTVPPHELADIEFANKYNDFVFIADGCSSIIAVRETEACNDFYVYIIEAEHNTLRMLLSEFLQTLIPSSLVPQIGEAIGLNHPQPWDIFEAMKFDITKELTQQLRWSLLHIVSDAEKKNVSRAFLRLVMVIRGWMRMYTETTDSDFDEATIFFKELDDLFVEVFNIFSEQEKFQKREQFTSQFTTWIEAAEKEGFPNAFEKARFLLKGYSLCYAVRRHVNRIGALLPIQHVPRKCISRETTLPPIVQTFLDIEWPQCRIIRSTSNKSYYFTLTELVPRSELIQYIPFCFENKDLIFIGHGLAGKRLLVVKESECLYNTNFKVYLINVEAKTVSKAQTIAKFLKRLKSVAFGKENETPNENKEETESPIVENRKKRKSVSFAPNVVFEASGRWSKKWKSFIGIL